MPTKPVKPRASAKLTAKRAFIMLSVLISYGVAAETPTSPETPLAQSLGMFELTLNNKGNSCQLQVSSKSSSDEAKKIPLLLKSPCYWIISSETKALVHYSFESVDADNTLLVAGTPLDWSDKKKSYQKLPDNTYCTQFLQGVVISRNNVFAVDEKMIAAHCETGLAIDEKIFYTMAHNPVRYQDKLTTLESRTTNTLSKDAPEVASELMLKDSKEKSFLDTVTDSIKELFSGKDKDAK